MSSGDIECLPLSRVQIREFASRVRKELGFGDEPYVDVGALFEFSLPKAVPGFVYDVRERDEMGDNHGLTNVRQKQIILRLDVYEGALDGVGRDRMTVIHEVGHLLLHGDERILHRKSFGQPKPYRDPEWQAKAFAGEFLVSELFANEFGNLKEASSGFGVSEEAARYQLSLLSKEGKIKRADLRSALL